MESSSASAEASSTVEDHSGARRELFLASDSREGPPFRFSTNDGKLFQYGGGRVVAADEGQVPHESRERPTVVGTSIQEGTGAAGAPRAPRVLADHEVSSELGVRSGPASAGAVKNIYSVSVEEEEGGSHKAAEAAPSTSRKGGTSSAHKGAAARGAGEYEKKSSTGGKSSTETQLSTQHQLGYFCHPDLVPGVDDPDDLFEMANTSGQIVVLPTTVGGRATNKSSSFLQKLKNLPRDTALRRTGDRFFRRATEFTTLTSHDRQMAAAAEFYRVTKQFSSVASRPSRGSRPICFSSPAFWAPCADSSWRFSAGVRGGAGAFAQKMLTSRLPTGVMLERSLGAVRQLDSRQISLLDEETQNEIRKCFEEEAGKKNLRGGAGAPFSNALQHHPGVTSPLQHHPGVTATVQLAGGAQSGPHPPAGPSANFFVGRGNSKRNKEMFIRGGRYSSFEIVTQKFAVDVSCTGR